MAGVLTMALGPARIRPRTEFFSFVLPVTVIAGLLFMHVPAMAQLQSPAHPGEHMAAADLSGSIASVGPAHDVAGEGGVHAGGVCLSSAAKFVDVLPVDTEPVRAAPLPGPLGAALRDASINRSASLSPCVLRR
jgi:hypothetical protein